MKKERPFQYFFYLKLVNHQTNRSGSIKVRHEEHEKLKKQTKNATRFPQNFE